MREMCVKNQLLFLTQKHTDEDDLLTGSSTELNRNSFYSGRKSIRCDLDQRTCSDVKVKKRVTLR